MATNAATAYFTQLLGCI